jgi:hypothetical protein
MTTKQIEILINNITDIVANSFYPCTIKIPITGNNNLLDKIRNFISPRKYECELFRFEILENNKVIYEILNEYEPESNLYTFFSGCKYFEFDIINNQIFTDGKINHRHLLMLNDFADFNIELEYVTSHELENFKQKNKQNIELFSYDDLISIIKDIFIKTKLYKYEYYINVLKAPIYDISLRELSGYKKSLRYNISDEEEITQIKNRIWKTGDGYFSPSTQIFSLKALQYTCLMNSKLYYLDINNLSTWWGQVYSLKPYYILDKFEGGIRFGHCEYTYWNKLINELNLTNYRPYFELINSSHIKSNYYSSYIPIHELIIFCKIIEKEGAVCSYRFEKINKL